MSYIPHNSNLLKDHPMGKLRTLLKEFVGCLRWTTGNAEALRLFAALLRFHLAKKTTSHDVLTCVQMKNPTSGLSWPMQLRIFSGDLFILTEVFFDECYRLPLSSPTSTPSFACLT